MTKDGWELGSGHENDRGGWVLGCKGMSRDREALGDGDRERGGRMGEAERKLGSGAERRGRMALGNG